VTPTPTRESERATALFGNILLYLFLSLYGTWILMGVIEEKTSRVVEVLLSTLRPRQLLAGKVLGIGTVALIQGVLIIVTALVCAAATGSNYLRGTNVSLLAQTFMWFLLGFAFYAMLYGTAGSLVSRQSEAQNAAFPVTVPLLVAYLFSFTVLPANHGNIFLTVLSFLPPTAPIAMPVRVAVGGAGLLDVAISAALMIVAIVWLARVAGTVYSRAILRSGKRTSWREVLRSDPPRATKTAPT
jgi:ABC-2 type transport system permease protein